jgi:sugar fermentation stimulation protein A
MPPLLQTGRLEPGVFVERLNRFVVRVRRGGVEEAAHLPNPGRLGEILLPGTPLLLEPRPHGHLRWKAIGATWSERWPGDAPRAVLLDTARINRLAERLIEEGLIPELRHYRIERREVADRDSRFDFLLRSRRLRYLLEVKSVTLAERGLAFFPDARTERGRRHLLTLARRGRRPGWRAGVLFLVQGRADRFLPDFHNDLAFARAFRAARSRVDLLPYRLAAVLGRDGRLAFVGSPERLAIPWGLVDAGTSDAGLYLLLLEVPREARIEVGGLGERAFPGGSYVYAGSARRGLGRRIARHLRLRKRRRWHVDFLRAHSSRVQAFPIRASSGECALAADVAQIGCELMVGFGSSDCRCPGHLVRFTSSPVRTAAFQELLTRWRHAPRAGPVLGPGSQGRG